MKVKPQEDSHRTEGPVPEVKLPRAESQANLATAATDREPWAGAAGNRSGPRRPPASATAAWARYRHGCKAKQNDPNQTGDGDLGCDASRSPNAAAEPRTARYTLRSVPPQGQRPRVQDRDIAGAGASA